MTNGNGKKDSRKWKAIFGLLVVGTLMALGAVAPGVIRIFTEEDPTLVSHYVNLVTSVLSWWAMAMGGFFGLYSGANVAQKIGTKDVFKATLKMNGGKG